MTSNGRQKGRHGMGLVKTGRRLAEDMHRRGEASEGTLPKATRRARKRVRSPLPNWGLKLAGYGAGRIGLV